MSAQVAKKSKVVKKEVSAVPVSSNQGAVPKKRVKKVSVAEPESKTVAVQETVCMVKPEVVSDVHEDVEVEVSLKKSNKRKTCKEVIEGLAKLIENFSQDVEAKKFGDAEKIAKRYHKELVKINSKVQKLQKKPNSESDRKNQQSGFSKPQAIAPEMAAFAGWNVGEPKSRNDVNKVLCAYIKEHKLQKDTDRRDIIPDSKLGSILRYNENEHGRLTFATMQKRLGHLFLQTEA